ncbi:hypothetical protein ACT009_03095 [Sphingomonas sp. Tas61C01]|uniref:hypothetical protein n=1 Tax=Sphingomonas sp. Tas61C01 TaxID=3458297 RepID=UPI00403E6927
MTRTSILTIAAMALLPASLQAQQAAPAAAPAGAPAAAVTPTVGASVFDSAGVEIGKVESVANGAVVVASPTGKLSLPATSIGQGTKGLAIAMTKADLDAAAAQAKTAATGELTSKLVPGTPVGSVDGAATLGTIKSADAQFVTLTTAKGDVKLPVAGFAAGPSGNVIMGMTQAQFDTALGGAAPAAPAAAGTAPAAATKPAAAPR